MDIHVLVFLKCVILVEEWRKNEAIARFSQFIYSNNNKPAFKFLEKYFFGIYVYKVYIKSPFQPHNTCSYQQYVNKLQRFNQCHIGK